MEVQIRAKMERGIDPSGIQYKGPFCRQFAVEDRLVALGILVERGEAEAMLALGNDYFDGTARVQQNDEKGIELYHKAVSAGSAVASDFLAGMYLKGGSSSIRKDVNKARRLFTRSVKLGGDPGAMYDLATIREKDGHSDFVYYVLASASAGHEPALHTAKDCSMARLISKEEYANALRSCQAAHEEMMSESRKKMNGRFLKNITGEG